VPTNVDDEHCVSMWNYGVDFVSQF
jgi:hypothetical protein